jgi:uncharacterized protein YndB with AHSA1/START domain
MTESAMTGAGAQIYQIYIRATAQQIWEAITTSEFRRKYFHGSRVESTFATGASMRSIGPSGAVWGDNVVLESDPPRLLVHTWKSLYDDGLAAEPSSRVSWRIEPQPDGECCRLVVTHDQLEYSPKTAASVSGGWMFIISGLKTVVETGEPLSARLTGSTS